MSTHAQTTNLPVMGDASSRTSGRSAYHAGGKTRAAGYVVVGLLALGIGVGGTLLVQQSLPPQGGPATAAAGDAEHKAQDHATSEPAAPSNAVYIPTARQQLIGVRTTEATHQTLERQIRTQGVMAIDETREAQVHTKVAGWVERVPVDFVGKPVRRGQVLFSIYSPELVATQKEYLLAMRARREFANSEFAETRDSSERLVAATRERLRLWDVSDAQIAQLERTGEVQRTITIASPFSGVVVERNVYPGQYISPEQLAFKIVDLSRVWAIGQVFEYELPFIKVGQPVAIEFPYSQSTSRLTGRVAFIHPEVDPQTRRARMHVEFANPGLTFKPGAFVTLVVGVPAEMALVVPREAVIDTGTRRYVILALDNGYFEPREVEIGVAAGDLYPVIHGLGHGDRVVTSAQFLVDSETNLQAAMKAMVGHGHSPEGGTSTPPAGGASGGAPEPPRSTPGMDHSQHVK